MAQLFEAVKIGNLELKNRIIFPAITTLYDTNYDLRGEERSATFYAEIARGGVGLMVIGALQAIFPGRREDRVAINHDKYLPELRKWVQAVHGEGVPAAAQLAVWNHWAPLGEGTPTVDLSPSAVNTAAQGFPQGFDPKKMGMDSRPATAAELHQIAAEVARAAVRAREAGFDAIELPAVSGNLISRVLTPATNQREDEYGGSPENRVRFLVEVISAIKCLAGADFPLICRISGEDMIPGGLTLEDSKGIAARLEQAGADAISVMPGWYETRIARHQMYVSPGTFAHLAAGIREAVKIPVASNIRINSAELAAQMVAQGKADLVAMGRSLLADPEMPRKAMQGRFREIRNCVACCVCYEDIAAPRPCGCSVNARLGKETVLNLAAAPVTRRIYVAGGGPAGLEAARVAALRGHRVTLFEKSRALGGQLRLAVLPPHKAEWQTLIDYLSYQMELLGVTLRLGTELTMNVVAAEKPDAVIVATGAAALIPEIPGIDGDGVATAAEILTGEKKAGDSVVIIGGGLVGCELADFLARPGRTVTVLEMREGIGLDIGVHNRWLVLQRLNESGVVMVADATVTAVDGEGARATVAGTARHFPAATVVIAAGVECPGNPLQALAIGGQPVYYIGDCVSPQRVRHAVAQGFTAGNSV